MGLSEAEIEIRTSLIELVSFDLTDTARSDFLKTKFRSRSGEFISLMRSDVDQIEVALRSLVSLDQSLAASGNEKTTLAQQLGFSLEDIGKGQKHLKGLIEFFKEMSDEQMYVLSVHLFLISYNSQDNTDKHQISTKESRISEIFRTIKTITINPQWFDNVNTSMKSRANRRGQDQWLYHTLDEICNILRERGIVVTRNPDSAPFGLLLDALVLVRPKITATQIDSYLQITRRGVKKSGFGRRWGEIEQDRPKPDVASSQDSDLDPGAGSNRYPGSTT